VAEVQSAQVSTQGILAPGAWDIDRDHSNVEFVARHLMSRVRGRFTDFDGVIHVDEDPARSSVEVSIDAASIDTLHEDRDAHLRGPEFLDVERFPKLSFRTTRVSPPDEEGRFQVVGELTIRDATRPVTLDVEYLGWSGDPWGGQRAAFSARTEIDRDDFGASWNVVLETGGLLVGKKVQIELEVEAVLRQQ
jgi:polyisoprenoid-binding protein YceI